MKKIAIVLLGVLLLAAAAVGLASTALVPVTIEAGEPIPAARAFARYGFLTPRLTDGAEQIDTAQPGTYPLGFQVLGISGSTTLTVEDTTPPALTPLPQSCFFGETVEIGAFVEAADATGVVLTFGTPPDFTRPGEQTVTVCAVDGCGNRTEVDVPLTVYAISHSLTVEAGTSPAALRGQLETAIAGEVDFAVEIDGLDLATPGEQTLEITLDGKSDRLSLTVVDTVPPVGRGKRVSLLDGQTAEPADFLRSVTDETDVTATFVREPDFGVGNRSVHIRLTDAGGNTAELNAVVWVYPAPATVTVELGLAYEDILALALGDAALEYDEALEDLFAAPTLGEHKLTYTAANGAVLTQTVIFTDTQSPVAASQNRTAFVGDTLEAADFVRTAVDASGIAEVVFRDGGVDTGRTGVQTAVVDVVDMAGNRTTLTATLTVIADTEPPVLYGASDKTVYIGETVSYRSGVSAWDNRDGSVTVQIDSTQVKLREAGKYPVTYTAIDAAGNKVTKTVTYTVSAVDTAAINALADGVLDTILRDGMSERERLRAIYDWSVSHLRYTAYPDKTDPVAAAFYGFRQGRGDCFVYYAVTRFLLSRAGIENLEIHRNDPANPHFWNLVKFKGEWYHLDTCPTYRDHPLTCFLLTDAEVRAYSENHVKDYYSFDATLYPRTP